MSALDHRTSESDGKLLEAYAIEGSELAFRLLVARYLDLVYGVAFRKTGSREVSQEISQHVLSILARKANGLKRRTDLGGWLVTTARLERIV